MADRMPLRAGFGGRISTVGVDERPSRVAIRAFLVNPRRLGNHEERGEFRDPLLRLKLSVIGSSRLGQNL